MIAYRFRIQVLISFRVLKHGVNMHPALMRKGRTAHKRLIGLLAHIGDLADKMRGLGQLFKVFIRDTVNPHLGLQYPDNGGQVRVAASFAVAVKSPLDMADPVFNRQDGICHGQAQVVMGMYA